MQQFPTYEITNKDSSLKVSSLLSLIIGCKEELQWGQTVGILKETQEPLPIQLRAHLKFFVLNNIKNTTFRCDYTTIENKIQQIGKQKK